MSKSGVPKKSLVSHFCINILIRLWHKWDSYLSIFLHLRREETEESSALYTDKTLTSSIYPSLPPVRFDFSFEESHNVVLQVLMLPVASRFIFRENKPSSWYRWGDRAPSLFYWLNLKRFSGIFANFHVCYSQLGQLPDQTWSSSWQVTLSAPASSLFVEVL